MSEGSDIELAAEAPLAEAHDEVDALMNVMEHAAAEPVTVELPRGSGFLGNEAGFEQMVRMQASAALVPNMSEGLPTPVYPQFDEEAEHEARRDAIEALGGTVSDKELRRIAAAGNGGHGIFESPWQDPAQRPLLAGSVFAPMWQGPVNDGLDEALREALKIDGEAAASRHEAEVDDMGFGNNDPAVEVWVRQRRSDVTAPPSLVGPPSLIGDGSAAQLATIAQQLASVATQLATIAQQLAVRAAEPPMPYAERLPDPMESPYVAGYATDEQALTVMVAGAAVDPLSTAIRGGWSVEQAIALVRVFELPQAMARAVMQDPVGMWQTIVTIDPTSEAASEAARDWLVAFSEELKKQVYYLAA